MAGTSRTTFTKRQKERVRQEKQAEKSQHKAERKQLRDSEKGATESQAGANLMVTLDEEGQRQGFDFHDFGR
jgi:urocanate hydratase